MGSIPLKWEEMVVECGLKRYNRHAQAPGLTKHSLGNVFDFIRAVDELDSAPAVVLELSLASATSENLEGINPSAEKAKYDARLKIVG